MGQQFQVNTYSNNWQDEPDILALPDGGFLVTWDSYVNEYDDGPSAYVLSGQRYNAAGRRVGGEFLIDGVDGAASTEPSIAPLSDGGYAVAWSYSPDGILGQSQAYVRAFDADGSPKTAAVRVDTIPLFEAVRPTVAATRDGGFLVFFAADKSDATFDDVYVRRFGRDGSALGREQRLNVREDEFDQGIVEAVGLSNRRVVAIWNSESTLETSSDLDSNEIRATVFSPTGAVVRSDVRLAQNYGSVGTGTGAGYDVAATAGGFVISQMEYGHRLGTDSLYHVVVQTFDAEARKTSGRMTAFRTDEVVYSTDVTTLATGEIVVVWEQQPLVPGEVGHDVMARVLSASGRPITAAFEVGTDYSGYDEQADPVVQGLRGGGFVVSYSHDNLDGDHEGVAARIFGRATAGNDRATVDASGYLAGGDGNDRLTGNDRANVLQGGTGDDALIGMRGDDALHGDNGKDTLEAGAGNDGLFGGAGHDRMRGGNGRDRLDGGSGNDTLEAGSGRDVLIGGRGKDRLQGGTDRPGDDFVFVSHRDSAPGAKRDVIHNFSRGGDDIDLRAMDARTGSPDTNNAFVWSGRAAADHSVWWKDKADDILLRADVNGDARADFELLLVDVASIGRGDVLL